MADDGTKDGGTKDGGTKDAGTKDAESDAPAKVSSVAVAGAASPEVSTKPYLVRAIHEWCTENGYTPYLTVVVDERTQVPQEHVRDGQIVLNVSFDATSKLQMGNEWIEFAARFNGSARQISVPIEQVAAIYARENGHGMGFEVSETRVTHNPQATIDVPTESTAPARPAAGAKPKLTVVK
jgi:stringent starvation protein B